MCIAGKLHVVTPKVDMKGRTAFDSKTFKDQDAPAAAGEILLAQAAGYTLRGGTPQDGQRPRRASAQSGVDLGADLRRERSPPAKPPQRSHVKPGLL